MPLSKVRTTVAGEVATTTRARAIKQLGKELMNEIKFNGSLNSIGGVKKREIERNRERGGRSIKT